MLQKNRSSQNGVLIYTAHCPLHQGSQRCLGANRHQDISNHHTHTNHMMQPAYRAAVIKPAVLSESMLTYCQMDRYNQISVKFISKWQGSVSRKIIWKFRMKYAQFVEDTHQICHEGSYNPTNTSSNRTRCARDISEIIQTLRGQRPISGRTYFRHICSFGVNFMQLWFSSQIDFWSRLWIPPQIFGECIYAN